MFLLTSGAGWVHIAAVALSAVATAFGLMACPLKSLNCQYAFLLISLASCVLLLLAFVMHARRRTSILHVLKLSLGFLPLAGIWAVLLILPSPPRVREASMRTQMINNGKNIGLGFLDAEQQAKHLPTDVIDPAGVPLLSWRVQIWPYVEQTPLFHRFDLKQSWNSERNRPLLGEMPQDFFSTISPEPGRTPWQGFVGLGTAFEPGARLSLAKDFPDGTSHTILFVEAKQQVEWSRPSDIAFGPGIPLPPLGEQYYRGGAWPFNCTVRDPDTAFHACMADGTVRSFGTGFSEEKLRALIVRNDGRGVVDD